MLTNVMTQRYGRWVLLGVSLLGGLGLQTQLYPSQERLVSTVLMFVALATAWNPHRRLHRLRLLRPGRIRRRRHDRGPVLRPTSTCRSGSPCPRRARRPGSLPWWWAARCYASRGTTSRWQRSASPKGCGRSSSTCRTSRAAAGITIPTFGDAPTRWLGNDGFYLLFLFIAVGSVAVAMVVSRSRGGYALRAIHQDEDAAAAMASTPRGPRYSPSPGRPS